VELSWGLVGTQGCWEGVPDIVGTARVRASGAGGMFSMASNSSASRVTVAFIHSESLSLLSSSSLSAALVAA
jgi:hypothetical protein